MASAQPVAQDLRQRTRDELAGRLVRELRVDHGLSPEELSWAIFKAQGVKISGRAIRYIEREGVIPHARTQFALAQFFERRPSEIWDPANARVVRVAA